MHEIPTGTNHWHFPARPRTRSTACACPAAPWGCCGCRASPRLAVAAKPPGINAQATGLRSPPHGASLAETLRTALGTCSDARYSDLGEASQRTARGRRRPSAGWPDVVSTGGLARCGRPAWARASLAVAKTDWSAVACSSACPAPRVPDGRIPHVVYLAPDESMHAPDTLAEREQMEHCGRGLDAHARWPHAHPRRDVRNATSPTPLVDLRRSVSIVGFGTVQNDKYLEVQERRYSAATLRRLSEAAQHTLERWRKEVGALTRRVQTCGASSSTRRRVEIPPLVDAIRPHVEREGRGEHRSVAGDRRGRFGASWRPSTAPLMRIIARALAPGVTCNALLRRRRMEALQPDVTPKPRDVKKTARKKGGKP